MTQIFVPTNLWDENKKFLKDLLFVPYEEMSVREKAWIDKATEFGEIYPAEYNLRTGGSHHFSTDIGCGGEKQLVELNLPTYVPKEEGLFLLRDVVQKLME